jgi:hypothetical protein
LQTSTFSPAIKTRKSIRVLLKSDSSRVLAINESQKAARLELILRELRPFTIIDENVELLLATSKALTTRKGGIPVLLPSVCSRA